MGRRQLLFSLDALLILVAGRAQVADASRGPLNSALLKGSTWVGNSAGSAQDGQADAILGSFASSASRTGVQDDGSEATRVKQCFSWTRGSSIARETGAYPVVNQDGTYYIVNASQGAPALSYELMTIIGMI